MFGYKIEGDDIGECWGIAAHPNGTCTIANGTYQGEKLSDLWEQHRELFGDAKGNVFPLLIKIIDAKADLSIQVQTMIMQQNMRTDLWARWSAGIS